MKLTTVVYLMKYGGNLPRVSIKRADDNRVSSFAAVF